MCAPGTKLPRLLVGRRVAAALKEHPFTRSQKSLGGGTGKKGKRDAGTFSVSASSPARRCLAVILCNEVPTLSTSRYLSIPTLSGSSSPFSLPVRGGEDRGASFFSVSLKDTTVSNTFNSSAGWGEAKAGGGEVGVCVCVRVPVLGRGEGLGSSVAFF